MWYASSPHDTDSTGAWCGLLVCLGVVTGIVWLCVRLADSATSHASSEARMLEDLRGSVDTGKFRDRMAKAVHFHSTYDIERAYTEWMWVERDNPVGRAEAEACYQDAVDSILSDGPVEDNEMFE